MNIRCIDIDIDDAEAFSALRRELTRTLESFRAQLSFTHPNAMFGSFVDGELAATAAVDCVS